MKTHSLQDVLRTRLTDEQIERIRRKAKREAAEYTLAQLRKIAGKTQVQTAKKAAISQASLAELERRRDYRLSTLRKYVEAIDGELEVYVKLGSKRLRVLTPEA